MSSPGLTARSLLGRRRCPRRCHADLIEPHVEHGSARLLHSRAQALRVGTEFVQIDACGGELERVADQPALHALCMLLDVELQG